MQQCTKCGTRTSSTIFKTLRLDSGSVQYEQAVTLKWPSIMSSVRTSSSALWISAATCPRLVSTSLSSSTYLQNQAYFLLPKHSFLQILLEDMG